MKLNPSDYHYGAFAAREFVKVPREVFFKIIMFLEENEHYLASSLLLNASDRECSQEKRLNEYKFDEASKRAGIKKLTGRSTKEESEAWSYHSREIADNNDYPDWLFSDEMEV